MSKRFARRGADPAADAIAAAAAPLPGAVRMYSKRATAPVPPWPARRGAQPARRGAQPVTTVTAPEPAARVVVPSDVRRELQQRGAVMPRPACPAATPDTLRAAVRLLDAENTPDSTPDRDGCEP